MYLVCLIQFVPNLFEHRIRLSSFNVQRYHLVFLWVYQGVSTRRFACLTVHRGTDGEEAD